MRKPFKKTKSEYHQAIEDYGRILPPSVLDEILEKSLEQYPKNGVDFDLLVDMKVLKIIQDDIERMNR